MIFELFLKRDKNVFTNLFFRLPTMDTVNARGASNKTHYSFGPNVKIKKQSHTADGIVVYSETIGKL